MFLNKYRVCALGVGISLFFSILLLNRAVIDANIPSVIFAVLLISLWSYLIYKRDVYGKDTTDSLEEFWVYGVPVFSIILCMSFYSLVASCFAAAVALGVWWLSYSKLTKEIIFSHQELVFPLTLLLWVIFLMFYRLYEIAFEDVAVPLTSTFIILAYYLYRKLVFDSNK